jgi:hypothetical protein
VTSRIRRVTGLTAAGPEVIGGGDGNDTISPSAPYGMAGRGIGPNDARATHEAALVRDRICGSARQRGVVTATSP